MMAVVEEARARAGGRRRSTGGSVSSNAVSSSSPRSFSSFFSSNEDDALTLGVAVSLAARAEEERPLRGRKVRGVDNDDGDDGGDDESTVVIFFSLFLCFLGVGIYTEYILRARVLSVFLSHNRGDVASRVALRGKNDVGSSYVTHGRARQETMSDRHM